MSATDAVPGGSTSRLRARQMQALLLYSLQEARHRWILVALAALTTLFLLALLLLVNVDVVEGTIASARLFGTWDLPVGEQTIRISDAVTVIQSIIVGFIATFGVLLAIFLTGSIVPRTLNPGWVDLLIAQPTPRPALILGRTLGAVAVIALSVVYLFGGSWAILTYKTGFGNAGFLLAGALILFTFLAHFAGMVLVGVVTRSGPVSILAGFGLWIVGHVLYPLHRFDGWSTALPAGWRRSAAHATAEGLYWLLPKTPELTASTIAATRMEAFAWTPVLASLPFILICLLSACWWFARQDY